MLKNLSLTNFVITKSCTIPFGEGFNVLSGETGAGKTMLLQGLSLLLGQKANIKLIRKGEEKASIQAVFSLSLNSPIYPLLQESGIDIDTDDDLVILREITLSGKNRVFINSQGASLPSLKSIAPYLIETISQHSQLSLKDPEIQLELLDEYGMLHLEKDTYQHSYLREVELEKLLIDLKNQYEKQKLSYPSWKESYEELFQANLKEGEEEELFETYKKMSHLQDLLADGSIILNKLSEDPVHLLHKTHEIHKAISKLTKLDPKLSSIESLLLTAHGHLSEAHLQLQCYLDSLENLPENFQDVEKRLSFIKLLQRKYNATTQELCVYRDSLAAQLKEFEVFEEQLEQRKYQYNEIKKQREKYSLALTMKRKEVAQTLSKGLTTSLQSLNMEGSQLRIEIKETASRLSGSDVVVFYLAANHGEDFYNIQEHASGGELSRILFSLKLLLADKERGKTLIFDEIDANIGGMTATLLGKKLQKLGESRQIICITHFPQVAAHADYHLHILKTSSDGRMMTEVKLLSNEDKAQELMRMLGGCVDLFSDTYKKNTT